MCLAIPGKVAGIEEKDGIRTGRVKRLAGAAMPSPG
jgi:hydrogenase maturation factor